MVGVALQFRHISLNLWMEGGEIYAFCMPKKLAFAFEFMLDFFLDAQNIYVAKIGIPLLKST